MKVIPKIVLSNQYLINQNENIDFNIWFIHSIFRSSNCVNDTNKHLNINKYGAIGIAKELTLRIIKEVNELHKQREITKIHLSSLKH